MTPSHRYDKKLYHLSKKKEKRLSALCPPSFLLLSCHFYWFNITRMGEWSDAVAICEKCRFISSEIKIHSSIFFIAMMRLEKSRTGRMVYYNVVDLIQCRWGRQTQKLLSDKKSCHHFVLMGIIFFPLSIICVMCVCVSNGIK